MIKKLSLFLIFAMILTSLVSCHGVDATPVFNVPDGLEEGKTYEISFWAKNDSNARQIEILTSCIESFEELYPNIKVNLKRYTDYGKIYNDVITNIATGTTPNVCVTYPDHIATYMAGENVVVPLDMLMSDKKYGLGGTEVKFNSVIKSEIIEEFLEEGNIGGVHYALPFMRSTEACYVNKTLVESLGFEIPEVLTWDFVFEVSEYAIGLGKTTVLNSKGKEVEVYAANEKEVLIPFIYKSTDNMMIQMLHQKNAGYSNSMGEINIFNDTTTGLLKEIGSHASNHTFSTFKIDGYPGNFFNKGMCIFAVDSTAGSTWIGKDAPLLDIPRDQIADFETLVMPVPQYDTDNISMISQGPSLCLFNKEDPGEVLASWLFMQYLLTDEVQIEFAKTEGYIPVTERAQGSEQYKDYLSRSGEDNETYYDVKIAASRLMLDNVDKTFVTPVFNGSTSLRNAAGHLIEDVTIGAIRKKEIDDEYIEQLYESTHSLYRLGEAQSSGGLAKLGKMPRGSYILLGSLAATWLAIITVFTVNKLKKRHYNNKPKK